jgi:hydrogenase maturation protein HypF
LPFHLPGGEKASRQPWRSGLALCWEAGLDWPQVGIDTSLLLHAWQQGINTPPSSSVGRLFDSVAALLGLCHNCHYEGEAAMRLEAIAEMGRSHGTLPLVSGEASPVLIDWQPLLPMMFDDKATIAQRAGEFHQILAETIAAVAFRAREQHSIQTVGLCGGVFQNRLLSELASDKLRQLGFEVMLATQIPCNDGSIAYGQVIEYLYRQEL